MLRTGTPTLLIFETRERYFETTFFTQLVFVSYCSEGPWDPRLRLYRPWCHDVLKSPPSNEDRPTSRRVEGPTSFVRTYRPTPSPSCEVPRVRRRFLTRTGQEDKTGTFPIYYRTRPGARDQEGGDQERGNQEEGIGKETTRREGVRRRGPGERGPEGWDQEGEEYGKGTRRKATRMDGSGGRGEGGGRQEGRDQEEGVTRDGTKRREQPVSPHSVTPPDPPVVVLFLNSLGEV